MSRLALTPEDVAEDSAILAKFRQLVAERGPGGGPVEAQIEMIAAIAMEAEEGLCARQGRGRISVVRMVARAEEVEATARGEEEPPAWINGSGLSNALKGQRTLSGQTLRRIAFAAGLEYGFRTPTIDPLAVGASADRTATGIPHVIERGYGTRKRKRKPQ